MPSSQNQTLTAHYVGTEDRSGVLQTTKHHGEQTSPTLHSTTTSDGVKLTQAAAQPVIRGAELNGIGETITSSDPRPLSWDGDDMHAEENDGYVPCITKPADGKANTSK